MDGVLKQHGVFMDYTMEDLEREREVGDRLWRRQAAEDKSPAER